MADIPHFAFPLQAVNGAFLTNDQDSPDDVAVCVETVLSTMTGDLDDDPEFGVPDPMFSAPVAINEVEDAVRANEPRFQDTLEGLIGIDGDELRARIVAMVGVNG